MLILILLIKQEAIPILTLAFTKEQIVSWVAESWTN